MWDAIKLAARYITCVFGKAGESYKKCPRCKGSGLLQQSFAPSNEPCWFCEGVGALPIIGLNGFVLARANSILETCKQSPQLCSPLKLALHSGKYPETRCNVVTFKPHEKAANLVHHFGSAPAWLGPSIERAVVKGEMDEFQDTHQEGRESMKKSREHSRYSLSSQTLESISKFPHLFQVPNRRKIQVSPSTPIFSSKNYLQSITMCSMATDEQRSEKGFLFTDMFRIGLFGSTSYNEIPSQSLVMNNANGQIEKPFVSIMQTKVLKGLRLSFPLDLGLKSDCPIAVNPSHRRPRKKRNCIREKSQKEALTRARKIIGKLKFQKDELSLAEENDQSDVDPFIKRFLSEIRSILHEPSTGGGQSLLFAAASKDALIRNSALYGQSWVDSVLSSGTLDLMRFLSTRHWPSKS